MQVDGPFRAIFSNHGVLCLIMRWRYLILGIFLSGPTAVAIQIWPQWPAYCISGEGRRYITDDLANRHLLFMHHVPESKQQPAIERYDADSGRLVSRIDLDMSRISNWSGHPTYLTRFIVSQNRNVICCEATTTSTPVRIDRFDGASSYSFGGNYRCMVFDVSTGRRLLSFRNVSVIAISPDGQTLAIRRVDGEIDIVDSSNGRSRLVIPESMTPFDPFNICFSPDSSRVLLQDRETRALHLFNLVSGEGVQSFALPDCHVLCGWRPGEARTFVGEYSVDHEEPVSICCYRHAFDQHTIGEGVPDLMLDSDMFILRTGNGSCDTDNWVGQFDSHRAPATALDEWLYDFRSKTGIDVFEPIRFLRDRGTVRIVDRKTGKLRFEKSLPHFDCSRLAIDGQFLLVDTEASPRLLRRYVGFPDPEVGSRTTAFAVYRTDPWPRWIWTTLGTGTLLLAFAVLARRRHVAIKRRRTIDLSAPRPARASVFHRV